jgi:hypothetical protein
MKMKSDYTDVEKIALFDKIHDMCRTELNDSLDDEEYDYHYFFEWLIENVLSFTRGDWNSHNSGKRV